MARTVIAEHQAIEKAWERIYGTRFDRDRIECIHFMNGFHARENED